MIFVDSNVPMYLIGGEHPNRQVARRVLERLTANGERLVTSAEVYQEVLHRFVALRRIDAIGPAFDLLDAIADEVLAIELGDVRRARLLLTEIEGLSARDGLHVAVMERHGIAKILSFDSGFDRVSTVSRIDD